VEKPFRGSPVVGLWLALAKLAGGLFGRSELARVAIPNDQPTARRFFREDDRAQALVELALVMPIFLMLVTGIFDVSRAVWQENTLAYAAREGTRYAIVHGSSGAPAVGPCSNCLNPVSNNLANVTNAVTAAAIGVYNIDVTIDYPDGGNQRAQRVMVQATAPFVPLPSQYMLGSIFQITLRGGSMLVIQR
jgi:hypothetical protein